MSARLHVTATLPLMLIGATVFVPPTWGGPACGARIATQIVPIPKSVCLSAPAMDCGTSTFTTTAPSTGDYVVYVLVSTSGELGGVKFGIDYDGTPGAGVDIEDWTSCSAGQSDALGSATHNWPEPGSGITLVWPGNCQTSTNMAVACAFTVAVYGPDVLDIVGHPVDGQVSVADCGMDPSGALAPITETVLPLEAAGAAGFVGMSGQDPCPPPADSDGDGIPDAVETVSDASLLEINGFEVRSLDGLPFSCGTLWDMTNGEMPGQNDNLPTGFPPTSADFPCGVFSFAIPSVGAGMPTKVEIDYSGCGSVPNKYYKYGPTPEDPKLHWYDFTGLDPTTGTGALIDQPNQKITLWLYDGKRGDDDLLLNGTIVDIGGPATTSPSSANQPLEPAVPGFWLVQNSPNPFGRSTRFSYRTPVEGSVTLRIFDIRGREVARPFEGRVEAGVHEIPWDSRDSNGRFVPAGVYFYRLETSVGTRSGKMVVKQ